MEVRNRTECASDINLKSKFYLYHNIAQEEKEYGQVEASKWLSP